MAVALRHFCTANLLCGATRRKVLSRAVTTKSDARPQKVTASHRQSAVILSLVCRDVSMAHGHMSNCNPICPQSALCHCAWTVGSAHGKSDFWQLPTASMTLSRYVLRITLIRILCFACGARSPVSRSFRMFHKDLSQAPRSSSHFQPTVAQSEQAESNTIFCSHKLDSETIIFWERNLDCGSVSEEKADIQICRPRLHDASFALIHCTEDFANTSQDTAYCDSRCT